VGDEEEVDSAQKQFDEAEHLIFWAVEQALEGFAQ